MTQPAVSIVVPCYNSGRFLDQMLASLEAQSYRNFEIVVVDDGSTEPETLAKLASLPPPIRIVRQPNAGLAAARNSGFGAARGEFVLPLDCDDALAATFLAESAVRLNAAPADVGFVFCDMRVTGALTGVLPRRYNRFDQLFINRLPYCLLLRKSAWHAVGGYDSTMRDGYEDWEFSIRLALAGFRGLAIARPLFLYRVSPDGMFMSRSARMHGKLWRAILQRHRQAYRWRSLRALRRRWQEPDTRVGLVAALLLVWAGKVLPPPWVSAAFLPLAAGQSPASRAAR